VLIEWQTMNQISDRQKFILTMVIREHIRTAAPVGSDHMVRQYNLDLSPATVRNEMAALTEMGYLRQPHTSAGRVPTEDGYRFFVGRLLQQTELPDSTRRMITHQFYQSRNDVDQWMRLAASVLATQSQAASLVTAPHPEEARFKHLELISTRGRQVLMVLVLSGGEVQQRIFTMSEPTSQLNLSAMADHLTQMLQNKNLSAIQAEIDSFEPLEQEVVHMIISVIDSSDALPAGEVFLDGIANILAEPEFAGSEDARRAIHVLEERTILQDLLTRPLLTGNVGGVHVLIGGEGTYEELRQFSVVLARYGTPGLATGMLGVLGPMRMAYGRSISTVRFIAGLLSEMVSENLVE